MFRHQHIPTGILNRDPLLRLTPHVFMTVTFPNTSRTNGRIRKFMTVRTMTNTHILNKIIILRHVSRTTNTPRGKGATMTRNSRLTSTTELGPKKRRGNVNPNVSTPPRPFTMRRMNNRTTSVATNRLPRLNFMMTVTHTRRGGLQINMKRRTI